KKKRSPVAGASKDRRKRRVSGLRRGGNLRNRTRGLAEAPIPGFATQRFQPLPATDRFHHAIARERRDHHAAAQRAFPIGRTLREAMHTLEQRPELVRSAFHLPQAKLAYSLIRASSVP